MKNTDAFRPASFFSNLPYCSDAPQAVPHAAGFSAGCSDAPQAVPHAAGFSAGCSDAPHAVPHAVPACLSSFHPAMFDNAIVVTSYILLCFWGFCPVAHLE
jgi:hypothetical protein